MLPIAVDRELTTQTMLHLFHTEGAEVLASLLCGHRKGKGHHVECEK